MPYVFHFHFMRNAWKQNVLGSRFGGTLPCVLLRVLKKCSLALLWWGAITCVPKQSSVHLHFVSGRSLLSLGFGCRTHLLILRFNLTKCYLALSRLVQSHPLSFQGCATQTLDLSEKEPQMNNIFYFTLADLSAFFFSPWVWGFLFFVFFFCFVSLTANFEE